MLPKRDQWLVVDLDLIEGPRRWQYTHVHAVANTLEEADAKAEKLGDGMVVGPVERGDRFLLHGGKLLIPTLDSQGRGAHQSPEPNPGTPVP